LDALESTISVAFAAPLTVGENVTLKATLDEEEMVNGRAGPLTVKPSPTTYAFEIVIFEEPVTVKVPDRVALCPTWTFPNEMDEGFEESCPSITALPETAREA
jgi:hypothetical protein